MVPLADARRPDQSRDREGAVVPEYATVPAKWRTQFLVRIMMDLRIPSGSFFVLLGLILIGMGILTPGERAALTDANVNLYCGFVMLAFGSFLLALAWRAAHKQP